MRRDREQTAAKSLFSVLLWYSLGFYMLRTLAHASISYSKAFCAVLSHALDPRGRSELFIHWKLLWINVVSFFLRLPLNLEAYNKINSCKHFLQKLRTLMLLGLTMLHAAYVVSLLFSLQPKYRENGNGISSSSTSSVCDPGTAQL